ncbi:MAG: glycosyltransferase [Sphingomonas taxi]
MNVLSIGILAHNEAAIIARTIASLAGQSILDPARAAALGLGQIEIVVVPNGCSDDTAGVAAAALAAFPAHVSVAVRELAQGGKSNAWNRFVHDLARPDATLIALMDADIEFGSADVLERLVERLHADPVAQVSTDRPVKDYRHKTRLSPARPAVAARLGAEGGAARAVRAIVLRARRGAAPHLAARGPAGRGRLPRGDAADRRLHPASPTKAPSPPVDVHHFYEPLEGVDAFVRHEARIIVGSVINAWLYTLLWEAGKRGHAGAFVRQRNDQDPDWVEGVCQQARDREGRWLVPRSFVLGRLAPLGGQPLGRVVRRAPIAVAATLATLPAVLRANAILRRPAARLLW